ncbi:hypothetical protein P3T40_003370 [Paraburkholderia sp. EB58]|uniref:hypothetical protein n=1 Tax=Paraburkholderia sp. EB58 TaxID=3035125 RepID=UPI003D1BE9E0
MTRALLCLLLGGCTVFPEHLQVLPTVSEGAQIGCCVIEAELPPSTNLSLTVTKPSTSLEIKAGAKWKF